MNRRELLGVLAAATSAVTGDIVITRQSPIGRDVLPVLPDGTTVEDCVAANLSRRTLRLRSRQFGERSYTGPFDLVAARDIDHLEIRAGQVVYSCP